MGQLSKRLLAEASPRQTSGTALGVPGPAGARPQGASLWERPSGSRQEWWEQGASRRLSCLRESTWLGQWLRLPSEGEVVPLWVTPALGWASCGGARGDFTRPGSGPHQSFYAHSHIPRNPAHVGAAHPRRSEAGLQDSDFPT